jgi:hypothetical protein
LARVITCHFAGSGKGFDRCSVGFHADVTVPLKHLAAGPASKIDDQSARDRIVNRKTPASPFQVFFQLSAGLPIPKTGVEDN